ncbi:hypothetical protein GGX14DRAFT_395130 [Mycena pura]|uniref:Uncharacterized protein n=1 Tax=Mycena pura TaxID=153505 RepID=A0AAD6VDS0_9AGAR|nr:hypothetical protein GGX14DRAFT_395130 [Mycena pura]
MTGDVVPGQRYHGFERWPSMCELHQTIFTRPKLALQRHVYHTVHGPEILDSLRSRLNVEIVGGVFGGEPLRSVRMSLLISSTYGRCCHGSTTGRAVAGGSYLVTRSACAPSLSHNRDQRQATGTGPAGDGTSGQRAASRYKRVNKRPAVDDEQRDLAGQVGGGAWARQVAAASGRTSARRASTAAGRAGWRRTVAGQASSSWQTAHGARRVAGGEGRLLNKPNKQSPIAARSEE